MSIRPFRDINRNKTKEIKVGNVLIGGNNPITVQSMTNTLTTDVKATIKQIDQIIEKGASVYMKLSPIILSERLKSEKSKRPLIAEISDAKMIEFIQEKLKERVKFYERAKFTFDAQVESEETFINRINHFLV